MLSQRQDFFYVEPCKKVFSDQTFPYENNILWTHNILSEDWNFFNAGGLEDSCLGKLLFTSLLGVSFRKAGEPEKCGQDLKSQFFCIHRICDLI